MQLHKRIWRKLRHLAQASGRLQLPWPVPTEVSRLIRVAQPYTMMGPVGLCLLYGLAREVCYHGVEGDIVECGVCNGGSAALLAAAIRSSPERRVWLYDTFEGIPAPGPKDGPLAPAYEGRFRGSIETVQEALRKARFPLERAVLRQGLFKETFQQPLPHRVALLHVDADWYESVLDCLRTFYPLIPDGGIIVLDDFGHWEGAREAFYDFCAERQLKPLLERAGYTQAFWRKGQEHDRSVRDQFHSGVYRPHFES